MAKGLIHIYHGNGKGKTTSGMGLSLRMCGAGKQVLIHQFLKNNTANERKILEQFDNVTFIDGDPKIKFTFQMTEEELEVLSQYTQEKMKEVFQTVQEGDFDLLFMDEILHLIYKNIVPESMLVDFLENKPEKLEVILTGYNPTEKLVELADYISFIQKEKHPYDQGIKSRSGIEY